MQEVRPIIVLKKTLVDHFMDSASWVLLCAIWVYVILQYPTMADTIPVHYGVDGLADGFGSKNTIFVVPIIITFIILLLKYINRFPHKFNYLAKVNEENAEAQYRMATRLINYLQLFLAAMFSYIIYKEIADAGKQYSTLGVWFILLLLPGVMIPTVYTVYRSLTIKPQKPTT